MFLLNFDNFVIKAGFHRLWLIRLFVSLFDSVMSGHVSRVKREQVHSANYEGSSESVV